MFYELLLILFPYMVYLVGGFLLLYDNEAILIPVSKKRWRVSFVPVNRRFFGRMLYIPNFVSVGFRLFQCRWRPCDQAIEPAPQSQVDRIKVIEQKLFPLVLCARVMGFLWLVCFPVSRLPHLFLPGLDPDYVMLLQLDPASELFSLLDANTRLLAMLISMADWFFVVTILFAYLLMIAMLILLACRYKVFEMSKQELLSTSFCCLVCCPLAINLPKLVSSKIGKLPDLLPLSKRLLIKEDYQKMVEQVKASVTEEMNLLSQTDAYWKQLDAYRQRLTEEQTR